MVIDPAHPGPTQPMLGARLRAAGEAVHAALYARLAEAGYGDIRPAHFALLKFPGPHGARPTELAARVGLSASRWRALRGAGHLALMAPCYTITVASAVGVSLVPLLALVIRREKAAAAGPRSAPAPAQP